MPECDRPECDIWRVLESLTAISKAPGISSCYRLGLFTTNIMIVTQSHMCLFADICSPGRGYVSDECAEPNSW